MKLYTLENSFVRITFLDLGATIYSFEIKPKNNRNIVLSTADLNYYHLPTNGYYGATIGRVAGRIGNGMFTIGDKTYHAVQNEKETNSLHGGIDSFAFKTFRVVKESDDEIIFEYMSVDGEGGYPGTVVLQVIYSLMIDGLKVEYKATTTAETILNITNHSYFNLDGKGTIVNHTLHASVTDYFTHDEKQLNDTRVKVTKDNPFYLTNGKKLRDIILHPLVNKAPAMGFDHLLVIDGPLVVKTTDLTMEVTSTYPAVQMYSTNFPSSFPLLGGQKVNLYHGLAIEPVDIVSKHDNTYKNLRVTKDVPYERTIRYAIKLHN